MDEDLPPPDVTHTEIDYDNMNSSFDFHPRQKHIVVTEQSPDSMSDSNSSGGRAALISNEGTLSNLDQRLDRLEKLTCTVFDAIRQLSQQIYSVDTKLADILTNGILGNNYSGDRLQNSNKTYEAQNEERNGLDLKVSGSSNTSHKSDDSHRLSWNERLEELRTYRETNGHCDVPQIYSGGLGTWVSAQRSQFKRFSQGKTSSLSKQRKEALETLGFSWSLRKRYSWDDRFNELRRFSEDNNGSCEVPNDGIYKALWTWCLNQRHVYKNGLEGNGPMISAERVAMMERIGFRWVDSPEDFFAATSESENDSSRTEIKSENGEFMNISA